MKIKLILMLIAFVFFTMNLSILARTKTKIDVQTLSQKNALSNVKNGFISFLNGSKDYKNDNGKDVDYTVQLTNYSKTSDPNDNNKSIIKFNLSIDNGNSTAITLIIDNSNIEEQYKEALLAQSKMKLNNYSLGKIHLTGMNNKRNTIELVLGGQQAYNVFLNKIKELDK